MSLTFIYATLASILLGMSKGGLKGLGILVVILLIWAFGAKASTGIVVPLLIFADIMAVIYFKKHVKWEYLLKFMPAMILGVVVAVYVGKDWGDAAFKGWMSVIILISVAYMAWVEFKGIQINIDNWLIAKGLGFTAGFTTMIGNLAGPFANLYFLATRLPKNELIGTTAWVFFIINLVKLPFHIFVWETIDASTLSTNLYLIPAVILGFIIGVKSVNLIGERSYRKFLLIVTAIGAIAIFFK